MRNCVERVEEALGTLRTTELDSADHEPWVPNNVTNNSNVITLPPTLGLMNDVTHLKVSSN